MITRLRYLVFLGLGIIVFSCYQPKPPVFQRIDEIQIIPIGLNKLELKGKAVYLNQEKTSGTLVGIHCDLYINNGYVTRIDQTLEQNVASYEEVFIPFDIVLDAGQIFQESESFENILQSLAQQKVNIKYDGHVTMKISGMEWDLPIEHTEQVNLQFPF